eukprot:TRINITY_DN6431_c0_g1_i2.p1 TRINITY_DN6431_c0_g1~~TRINITY_DN6431_c0_g1_i2.p1  ORF type:complete len:179 (+),score=20.28 TRINITY_DN6431_c0_g1_i2:48-584(+)
MGNVEVCSRGHVQFTSAGRGITHSEANEHESDMVHFIQVWVTPARANLKPSYKLRKFRDEDKQGKLCLIVSGEGRQKSIAIHQDIKVYAALLRNGEEIQYETSPGRSLYVHVVQDVTGIRAESNRLGITLNRTNLAGGDGAFVTTADKNAAMSITLSGRCKKDNLRAEVLVFDVANTK